MSRDETDRAYAVACGMVLRARRAVLGIDLGRFAKQMGFSSSGWSRVETGETTMTLAQLRRAARVLDVEPHVLQRAADIVFTGTVDP